MSMNLFGMDITVWLQGFPPVVQRKSGAIAVKSGRGL
jgi:hypothetical protein